MNEIKKYLTNVETILNSDGSITFTTFHGEVYTIICNNINSENLFELEFNNKVVMSGKKQIMIFLELLERGAEI